MPETNEKELNHHYELNTQQNEVVSEIVENVVEESITEGLNNATETVIEEKDTVDLLKTQSNNSLEEEDEEEKYDPFVTKKSNDFKYIN